MHEKVKHTVSFGSRTNPVAAPPSSRPAMLERNASVTHVPPRGVASPWTMESTKTNTSPSVTYVDTPPLAFVIQYITKSASAVLARAEHGGDRERPVSRKEKTHDRMTVGLLQ